MKPLSGIRVIEFCSVAAGPFCSMLLADMGADVVKIEHPEGGDSLRQWPPLSQGYSENFASLNRNKRSITLDLKDQADRARALKLTLDADIVLESNRPGVMKRLGLDFESLSKCHENLVYCSISAFGQDGPRAQEAGFDLTIQAMSGIMSVTGRPDDPPVKCGVPISDFATGLYAAFAIATALLERGRERKSIQIDVSMFGSSLAVSALQTSEYFGFGRDPTKLGSAHPRNAPYQAFKAKDGFFAMAAGNNKLFESACAAVGCSDLTKDPRFLSTGLRAQNQKSLVDILEANFASKTCEELLRAFRSAGVPCAPINTFSQALGDPQVAHAKWVEQITLPSGVTTMTFGSPIKFSGQGFPIYRAPPSLGQHNDEILNELFAESGSE